MKKKMMKSKKAKLLATATIAFIVLSLAISVLVNLATGHLSDAVLLQVEYAEQLDNFKTASLYLTDEARFCATTGQAVHYDNYWNEVNNEQNREKSVAMLQQLGLKAEEQALLDQIAALSNSLVPLEEKAMNLALGGDIESAVAVVFGAEYNDVATEISSLIGQLDSIVSDRAHHGVDAQNNFVSMVSIASSALLAIAMISTFIMVAFVLKELLPPILIMREALTEFADGYLRGNIEMEEDNTETGDAARAIHEFQHFQKEIINDIDSLLGNMADGNFNIESACKNNYKGDYSNILTSINRINHTLNATLKDIRLSAEQVDAGAEQVASGAQALSQGATEQASSTQELAATVNEINTHVFKAGQYADDASIRANMAGNLTAECNKEMKELVSAIDNISKSSEEISKIIKTIEDIAFQTNILALNAAVEAARAGAAGKGFAVVADEVRNLATKSAEASQSTAELIEASMSAVNMGVQLVDHTASNLQSVADNAQEVGEMVGQIAISSKEQAASIEQVTTGIDQIASVVQTNSATAEESAAASEQLSSQAAMLKKLVDRFQLRD